MALLDLLQYCRIPGNVKDILLKHDDAWISAMPTRPIYIKPDDIANAMVKDEAKKGQLQVLKDPVGIGDAIPACLFMPLDDVDHDDISFVSMAFMYDTKKEAEFDKLVKKLKPQHVARFKSRMEVLILSGRSIDANGNAIAVLSW
jgi:hypothetical protein